MLRVCFQAVLAYVTPLSSHDCCRVAPISLFVPYDFVSQVAAEEAKQRKLWKSMVSPRVSK